jgi:Zn-dependent protease
MLSLLSDPTRLIFYLVALILAITVHEFSHALVATILGDPTPKSQGRLSLNPLVHMDVLGTLTLLIAGFGWGRPVIYNPYYLKGGRFAEFLVAIAGPVTNLITAFIFALPGRIYLAQTGALISTPLFVFLAIVAELNIMLAVFNLIPIPPLDGSKILYLIFGRPGISSATTYLEQVGPIVLLGLILLDRVLNTSVLFTIMNPLLIFFRWLTGATMLPF